MLDEAKDMKTAEKTEGYEEAANEILKAQAKTYREFSSYLNAKSYFEKREAERRRKEANE